MSEFALRFRRHILGGGPAEYLDYMSFDLTAPLGDVSTLMLTVSQAVTGTLPDLLEIGMELWDGENSVEIPNGRFISSGRTGDELDLTGMRKLTLVNIVSFQLSKATLESFTGQPRRWTDNAGLILGQIIMEAQGRGWGSGFSLDFTSLADSNGVLWSLDDLDIEFEAGQTVGSILVALVDQGVIEFQTIGRMLRLFVPGTGEDRSAAASPVIIGGSATSLPFESSIADLATAVTVRGEEASYPFTVEGAIDSGLGRLETTISGSGIIDRTTAGILAAESILNASAPRHS